jgi:hypothetical protein
MAQQRANPMEGVRTATREVEQELKKLRDMVSAAAGALREYYIRSSLHSAQPTRSLNRRRLTWQHLRDKFKS